MLLWAFLSLKHLLFLAPVDLAATAVHVACSIDLSQRDGNPNARSAFSPAAAASSRSRNQEQRRKRRDRPPDDPGIGRSGFPHGVSHIYKPRVHALPYDADIMRFGQTATRSRSTRLAARFFRLGELWSGIPQPFGKTPALPVVDILGCGRRWGSLPEPDQRTVDDQAVGRLADCPGRSAMRRSESPAPAKSSSIWSEV